MKYEYRVWCLEGTNTKKMEWHFPIKDEEYKVPQEEFEDLFWVFANREDIRTLVIDCEKVALLYSLKEMFMKLLGNALREKDGKYLKFNVSVKPNGESGVLVFKKRKRKNIDNE